MTATPPVALTIAGSDSGGGAGIQADLRMFAALGVHGASAITALTAQSTVEVRGVLATPAAFLRTQIETVLDDLPVAATKTGMLATAENVRVVAELAAAGRLPHLVVDPVMVSSSGHRLLDADAEQAYLDELLPHAHVITPNQREAAAMLERPIRNRAEQAEAAAELGERTGAIWVVVKGGDATGDDEADGDAVDIAWSRQRTVELRAPRVATRNNHGTGCSFAAAIAALVARGERPPAALEHAKGLVHDAIVRAADWQLGAGHGPIDHLGFEQTVS